MAKLQTRNRGTSIFVLPNRRTTTTMPFPSMAKRNTTQTPQRRVHQPKRSSQGINGPKMRWIFLNIQRANISRLRQTTNRVPDDILPDAWPSMIPRCCTPTCNRLNILRRTELYCPVSYSRDRMRLVLDHIFQRSFL